MNAVTQPATSDNEDILDASDVWLVPKNGRVIFDDRGNSVWQWPGQDDPFGAHSRLEDMNAADLSIAEPTEIRRSRLPWMHESERTQSANTTSLAPKSLRALR